MDKKCTVGSLYIIYPLFPIYGTVWGKSECLVFYFIIFNLWWNLFSVYSPMNFNTYRDSYNYHHNQDSKGFPHLLKLFLCYYFIIISSLYLQSPSKNQEPHYLYFNLFKNDIEEERCILSIMHLRFIQVVGCISIVSLFIAV